jgi:hypothetical protein
VALSQPEARKCGADLKSCATPHAPARQSFVFSFAARHIFCYLLKPRIRNVNNATQPTI